MVEAGPARSRREQGEATRLALLTTAERLFAERGIAEVSNRQIVEAAGQANNSALSYHVGTRTDLLVAISRHHLAPIARRAQEMLAASRGSDDARDHVASLVLPYTRHLADLGPPSWYARFNAQLLADPAHADVLGTGTGTATWLAPQFDDGLARLWVHVPDLPADLGELRGRTMRAAVIHTCADEERREAGGGPPVDWELVGEALVDTVTGALLAPRRRH